MRVQRSTHARHLAHALYMSCTSGCSLNDNFESPEKGYMVGGFGKELTFPTISQVSLSDVETWIEDHKLRKDQYYGVWVDDGKVYFDVSVNLQSKEQATKIGKVKKQIAIWDLNESKEIKS
jgi:hypothetical protein